MAAQSREAFPAALSKLLIENEISGRELARRTGALGWGTGASISFLLNGHLAPTIDAMEAIASALQIRPEFFAEYRMAVIRRDLDPARGGFAKALRTLDEVEGA